MKNIFLISSDIPVRYYGNHYVNQNIYITSGDKFVCDEYVTDGIEVIRASSKLVNAQSLVDRRDWKKIVLTTDTKLIEDGVQPIIDNYLEWFVENPTCEEVEVIKEYFWEDTFRGYSLRLPKQGTVEEEPKCSCKVGEPYNNTCCKVHGKLNDDFENALSSFKTSLNKKYDNSVLTIQLTKEEARGLLTCIMRTSAKGKDLDVGEMVEEQLVKFLNLK
jgi:hypothetical protein